MDGRPDGYPAVSPYLLVADAEATLAFLEAAFGAVRLRATPRQPGRGVHAEARIGDSVVMLGEAPGGPPAHVHLYVPDADLAAERAIAAGATVVRPVAATPDGERRGGVAAPDGTVWWIATAR